MRPQPVRQAYIRRSSSRPLGKRVSWDWFPRYGGTPFHGGEEAFEMCGEASPAEDGGGRAAAKWVEESGE